MSTSAIGIDQTATESNTVNISTTLLTYRTYGAYDEKGQATGFKDGKPQGSPSVLSETQTKKNWEGAEKNGSTVLTENAFKFYSLLSLEDGAFETLVPDATQRLYIIQKGIDALQTAAANKIQQETKDKTSKDDPDEFVYNGDTIDLIEYINKAPERKNLTEEEKFFRAVGALNPARIMALLSQYKSQVEALQVSQGESA